MKLRKLRIENFRSFKDETICFDDYTCLVGEWRRQVGRAHSAKRVLP